MAYTIIDVDSHVTEPPDVWTSRVATRHLDRVPQIHRVDGKDVWFIDGEPATPVGPTAPAGWSKPPPDMPMTYDDLLPAAYDAKARLELLDDVGIWAQLLYPNVGGFGGQRFLRLGDRDVMYECVRAYNDWQVDWASADARRLIPVASMPFWDVDDCVREAERCAELGFTSILFTGEPHRFDLPYLGDPYWDPLWATASGPPPAREPPRRWGRDEMGPQAHGRTGFRRNVRHRGTHAVPQKRSAGLRRPALGHSPALP